MKDFSIKTRIILDSRGQKTIEAVLIANGVSATASVPSGTSTGKFERPIVDVEMAKKQIEGVLQPLIKKYDLHDQQKIDYALAGTDCGANAILAVSIAVCKAGHNLPNIKKNYTPLCWMLSFEGGAHANSSLNIQEFLFCPTDIWQGVHWYQKLKEMLLTKGYDTDVGLEGGFSPNNLSDVKAVKILSDLTGGKIKLGIDAGSVYLQGKINFDHLIKTYPLYYLEDLYNDEDYDSWIRLTKEYGKSRLIVGDDLTVTNPERIKKMGEIKACNAVIIKPNQIGTVTQAMEAVNTARYYGMKIIVSHRSGETNDDFIAEFSLAMQADYVKFGAPVRGERVAKYNRLL